MTVITLSREMGSLGDEIALAVAARLNLRVVGRDLINHAARQAGVPEVALAEIDELGLLGVKPSPEAFRLYHKTVSQTIHELATTGDLLLVGRGGQMALAANPAVLHVRVIAPRDLRIQRVQESTHLPPEIAAARIDASDRVRADYLRRHYHTRLDYPGLYDLVLNTRHISLETAVNLICQAAQERAKCEPEEIA